MNINLIKDLITIILVFLPPILFFSKYYLKNNGNKFLLIVMFVLYIVSIPYTQNLAPFIIVIFSFSYIRNSENYRYESLNGDNERFDFGFKNFKFREAISYAIASYIGAMIISAIVIVIMEKTNNQIKNQEIVDILQKSDMVHFLLTVPVAVIFAPVVEEFVFRYLLFEKILRGRVGIILSIVISSLIFGAVHFNVKVLVPITFIGAINCYLIHKKGYWYAVFNHFVFNFIPIASMLILRVIKLPSFR